MKYVAFFACLWFGLLSVVLVGQISQLRKPSPFSPAMLAERERRGRDHTPVFPPEQCLVGMELVIRDADFTLVCDRPDHWRLKVR